jgi:hypothetical protein
MAPRANHGIVNRCFAARRLDAPILTKSRRNFPKDYGKSVDL